MRLTTTSPAATAEMKRSQTQLRTGRLTPDSLRYIKLELSILENAPKKKFTNYCSRQLFA
jgi:hypothetical protein